MTRENQSDSNDPSGKQGSPSKEEQQRESGSSASKSPQSGKEHAQKSTSNRGFAAMDEKKQRDIASAGGRAAHEKGTAHEFDSAEAREAGRKGGEAVSENRQHMAEIGRKGGEARQAAASLHRNQGESKGGSQGQTGR
jgi:general stress protein YciG